MNQFEFPGRTPDAEVGLKTVSPVIETAKWPVWLQRDKQEEDSIGICVRKASVGRDMWGITGHFNDLSFSLRK